MLCVLVVYSLLLLSNVSLNGYATVDGHLGAFQFLGVMNTVVMSSHVEVLVWMYVFIFLG